MRLVREEGQNLVLVAMISMVLMGMLALTIDGGWLMVMRRYMQNAADAAAVAGARALALHNTEEMVHSQIEAYAVAPHFEPDVEARYYPHGGPIQGVGSDPASAFGVVVTTTVEFPTFFAGVMGIPTLHTAARSVAIFGSPEAVGGLWPVAVEWDDIFPGCPTYRDNCVPQDPIYILQDPAGPGGFHWLDWDGPPVSAVELADNVEHPRNSPVIHADSWVQSGPGAEASSANVLNALRSWIDNYGGVPVTIIVTDQTLDGGSNLEYHVAGFAAVTISGFDFGPGIKQYGDCDVPDDYVPPGGICGTFERMVANTTQTIITGGGDYGVYSVRMINP
jgi:hypothetical protein